MYSFKRCTEMVKQIKKLLCSSQKPWLNGPTSMIQPITATSHLDHSSSRFAKQKTDRVTVHNKNAEPSTIKSSNKWGLSILEWMVKNRIANYGEGPGVLPHLLLNKKALDRWMSKFILKIRRLDGAECQPNTIYQITCGLMHNNY